MDDLIKQVKTYRLTQALDQRLRLAEGIFRHIEPKLRQFVLSSVAPTPAPDVLQEVLKAVAMSLRKFEGSTAGEFWAWCYRIARNKISDHFRRCASDRLQTMSEEELRPLLDHSSSLSVRTPGVSHDLEYAMKLLTRAKPECHGLLWAHYVQGFNYGEIAEERGIAYDAVRMKISRCLDEARALLS